MPTSLSKRKKLYFDTVMKRFLDNVTGLMSEKEIGALVVREGENITGIMSERDYARKIILQGRVCHYKLMQIPGVKDQFIREVDDHLIA